MASADKYTTRNEESVDRSTLTFPCPSCDKIYLTQHSLTRHSHNHKKTSEHVCPSCKVVFYRKDLLVRHMKMHDPVQGGNREGRRRRCHTACLNCRIARIRCDSSKPCTSCAALGKQCTYSTRSARVSTNARVLEVNVDNDVSNIFSKPSFMLCPSAAIYIRFISSSEELNLPRLRLQLTSKGNPA